MLQNERKAVRSLSTLVRRLSRDKIFDADSYREWKKSHKVYLKRIFWFEDEWPIPDVSGLVKPFFHPTEPLIGLNYTPLAHNTLYKFPDGWTVPLRLCRGIVFDRDGNLVAKPFPKFFNYGEHPETSIARSFSGPVQISEKFDGHLGIIFQFNGRYFVTTRGSFESRTAKIATEMLAEIVDNLKWYQVCADSGNIVTAHTTILVEIIHPETHVITNYGNAKKFVLIGAYDNVSLIDYGNEDLVSIAEALLLKTAVSHSEKGIAKTMKLISSSKVKNKEGFVVRLENGIRIKFKFTSYIGKMVAEKLSYSYIMKRLIDGNLKRMIDNLPEELYAKAEEMVAKIKKAKRVKSEVKEKRQYLYELVKKSESTPYYRSVCREYLRKQKIK